jgi:hypothetical protein
MKTHGGDSLLRTPAVEMEKWGHTSHVEISVVIAANRSSDWRALAIFKLTAVEQISRSPTKTTCSMSVVKKAFSEGAQYAHNAGTLLLIPQYAPQSATPD